MNKCEESTEVKCEIDYLIDNSELANSCRLDGFYYTTKPLPYNDPWMRGLTKPSSLFACKEDFTGLQTIAIW